MSESIFDETCKGNSARRNFIFSAGPVLSMIFLQEFAEVPLHRADPCLTWAVVELNLLVSPQ